MAFIPPDDEKQYREVMVTRRQEQEAYEQAQREEENFRREALSIQQTIRTRGWKHVEALLTAALSQVTERALTPSKTLDEATLHTIQAQGAIEVVNKFKAALAVASTVEKAESPQGEQ